MAMPGAYFDTSVLLKRYIQEPGSRRAQSLLRRYRVFTSALATVEIASALARRRHAADLAEKEFQAIVRQVVKDRTHWHLVEVASEILDRAEAVIWKAGVRTLDAVHLASALVLQAAADETGHALPFVTGDDRQRDAAETLEMKVIWIG